MAIQGKIPDIVPVSPLIHNRFAYRILGKVGWKPVFELHQNIGSIHFRGPLGVYVSANLPEAWTYKDRVIKQQGQKIIRERKLETPEGSLKEKWITGFNSSDPTITVCQEPLIKKPDDWRIYGAYLEEWLTNKKSFNTKEVTEAFNVMGDNGISSVGLSCVFGHLGSKRTMEKLLVDLYRCPDIIKDVSKTIGSIIKEHVRAFLQSPSEVLFYDICWATGADLSPKFFKEYVEPDIRQVIKMVKDHGNKYVGFYTLGRIRRHLPLLVDVGADFIETFEPNQGDISLREAKELYGNKICLMGNFDSLLLSFGRIKEIKKETCRCLLEGMEGGGYILVTGDEVPVDAKMENLEIMVKTAKKYGRY
jgi:hypothetical protein